MIGKAVAGATIALVAALGALGEARAAEAPMELKWAHLMPSAAAVPAKPKTFFSGATPHDGSAASSQIPEGKWMSLKSKQPGGGTPPSVVAELDGKRVRIGGYVVPLDFEATSVKEFLLVPFVGACIHVPPPPANQIIYVKSENSFDVGGSFEPVTVTGTIKTETAFTGLADAGYSIEAEVVELLKP
ncbi:MAG TPA: DUF3299 domain-containing protein [Hyphomicrobiaceae bacterium]|nr:DUF3299 domain-containing protein [Hyphomicrobiaceae bacterium]